MLVLDWKPNKKNDLPLYKQIIEYIKNKIEKSEWPVGSILPSQRQLAAYFEVNRSTISIAIDELIADGLLEGKVGCGTRIINNTWSLMRSTIPPDWDCYIEAGLQHSNLPMIQEINQYETKKNILRLGKCELSPELYPAELMQKVLINLSSKIKFMGYEEPKGLFALRKQLSCYFKSWGINASPSSILIVSGALQALQLISLGLSQAGSTLLLETPSYLYSLNLFQSAGLRFCGLPLDTEGIQLGPLAYQKERQNNSTFLYTIPCFHNPTGISMSEQRRKNLMTLCEKEQLPIIEDDVYRELWLDSPPPPPLKSLDKHGLVLYIGSLSKTLSPGLRIGWIVGPETVINHLADIKMQNDYGSSSLSQWAATEWLADGLYQQHLENVRSQLRIRREICTNILNTHFKGLAVWNIPAGGLYIWLTLMVPIATSKLFRKALKSGLLITPGNIYERNNSKEIRISYGFLTISELEKSLTILAAIIRDC